MPSDHVVEPFSEPKEVGIHSPTPAVATARGRPSRVAGLTASGAGALVPEPIRKKFMDGWKTHVPFQYLTDKYCSFTNRAATKELNDLFSLDNSGGTILSVAKELAFEPELSLTFDEWFQAQDRLLQLILTYLPDEHDLWAAHFDHIIHHPNRALNWSTWLEYDSIIRRRACSEPIDPSLFHLSVWNEIEAKHITNRAIAAVQRQFQGKIATDHTTSGTRNSGYSDRSRGAASSPQSRSFRSSTRLRCFVCGSDDPGHRARSCTARRLVNGKDSIILTGQAGGARRDRDGVAYCFSFNGHRGCNNGANCEKGKHWCTICGGRDGLHCAQDCTSL